MRNILAYPVAAILKVTGYRFPKTYRLGISKFHRTVYAALNTTKANRLAG